MAWPTDEEAADERSLGGNQAYCDMREFSWEEACAARDREDELIQRIEQAVDPEAELYLLDDSLYDDDVGLYGLDIGVASTVVGLSAAGCIPCCSCNAGAYGGSHKEDFPLIAFFAPRQTTHLLLECAEEAGSGLENGDYGTLLAYSNDIWKIREFGRILIKRHSQFESQKEPRGA